MPQHLVGVSKTFNLSQKLLLPHSVLSLDLLYFILDYFLLI